MNRLVIFPSEPMGMLIASFAVIGLALALMTAAAQAQMTQQTQMNNAARVGQAASKAGEDKSDKPKANDKAYNAALHNLPDKQYDPWRGVR
jgi:hypothetical protein